MKKKILLLAAMLACLCMMTACGGGQTADAESNDEFTGHPYDEPADYSLEMEEGESYMASAVLNAYDENGEVLWTAMSEDYEMTELCEPVFMGVHNWHVYYCAGGVIYCLDVMSGAEFWANKEFGGQVSAYDFDDDGTLYAAGYYGPALGVIGQDGEIIALHDSLNRVDGMDVNDWRWPCKLELTSDGVIISYDGGLQAMVDPKTGEAMQIGMNK